MLVANTAPAQASPWAQRLLRSAWARIVIGSLASLAPVALTMAVIQALIDKPYRQVWPPVLATLLCIGAYCWFVRVLERRAVDELSTRHAVRESSVGALLGFATISTVTALLWFTGVLQFAGFGGGRLFAPLAEMILASVLEEILFRGVLFRILIGWLGVWKALAISAVLFGLAHLPNEGFSMAAFVVVVLAGALFSAAYLLHQRLWLPIGLHFGWNFTSSAVFGLSTSGSSPTGYLRTTMAGPEWLTGGRFGVEASMLTLIVIAAFTAAFLALRHRRQRLAGSRGQQ